MIRGVGRGEMKRVGENGNENEMSVRDGRAVGIGNGNEDADGVPRMTEGRNMGETGERV